MALTELLILEFGASVGETKLIGSQFGVIFFFLSLFFFFFLRGGDHCGIIGQSLNQQFFQPIIKLYF